MPVPHIVTPESVVVFLDGTAKTLPRSHPNAEPLIRAINDDASTDVLYELVNVSSFMALLTEGQVVLARDAVSQEMQVLYAGQPVRQTLATRIIEHYEAARKPIELLRLLGRIKANTSKADIADEIYDWIECGGMPITEDGHLIAFKLVKRDYRSFHDHNFMNTVGTWVQEKDMSRVNYNRHQECSAGLHFCSPGYLPEFGRMNGTDERGSRIIILKVDPADIATIPTDYRCQKGRAIGYWIIGEVTDENEILALFKKTPYIAAVTPDDKTQPAISAARDTVASGDWDDDGLESEWDEEEDDWCPEDEEDDWLDHRPEDWDNDDEGEDCVSGVDDTATGGETEFEDEVDTAPAKKAMDYVSEKPLPETTDGLDSEDKVSFINGKPVTFSRDEVKSLLDKHGSQRAVMRATGLPRTTLQGWIKAWGL